MKKLFFVAVLILSVLSLRAEGCGPEHLYIIGSLNEDGSYNLEGLEFHTEDRVVYTCDNVTVNKQPEAVGPDVYIIEGKYNERPLYCYENEAGVSFENGIYTNYAIRKDCSYLHAFQIPKVGTYDFMLDFSGIDELKNDVRPIITVGESRSGTTTSVEALTGDNQPARYYNLQGMPVSNPAAGTYIMVRTGESRIVRIH